MKPEAELQYKVIHFLRLNNILCFAPCNEAFMTLSAQVGKREGNKKNFGLFQHYVNMGFEKGTPDIFIFHKGRTFVLELKSPGGKLSPSQIGFITRLEREDIPYLVTDCYYTALDKLDEWGVVKN